MDLMNTYTHDSKLQAITAPPLITTATAKPFPACYVTIIRCLATASNSGDSSASRIHDISSQPPVQNSLTLPLAHNNSVQTMWKFPFVIVVPTVALLRICCLATGTCLPSC
jgi:hypothetical protein